MSRSVNKKLRYLFEISFTSLSGKRNGFRDVIFLVQTSNIFMKYFMPETCRRRHNKWKESCIIKKKNEYGNKFLILCTVMFCTYRFSAEEYKSTVATILSLLHI